MAGTSALAAVPDPAGYVNAKYGIDPGVVLYTTQSAQYDHNPEKRREQQAALA